MGAVPAARVLVVAPHSDDETLGCGGALLNHAAAGAELHWLVVTQMTRAGGYTDEDIARRAIEIREVTSEYGFASVVQLPFKAATLDAVPLGELIDAMAAAFDQIKPNALYLPYPYDAHSDHRRCFRAGSACAKWFRRGYLSHVLAYEVPSETGFSLDPAADAFRPNAYARMDEAMLERKIDIMRHYAGEMADFPFPRSPEAIQALARLRGSECGSVAAEGFALLRSTW